MDRKNWIWILVVVLVLVIFYVFGWFGNEPLLAPFDATVQLTNAPPTIFSITAVTDVDTNNNPMVSSGAGDVQPIAAVEGSSGIVYAVVDFIAQDPNGAADLPNSPSIITFGSPTGAVSEIAVRITSPQNGIRCPPGPACRNRDATGGVFPTGASSTCSSSISGLPANQKRYICFVQMQYYDEPSTAPKTAQDDFWIFSLYIEDITGNGDSATSADFVVLPWDVADEAVVMDYLTIPGTDTDSAESLTWTGVSVTATDTIGNDGDGDGTDGTGLTFQNRGNLPIATATLKPQDLTGNVIANTFLEVESMSAYDIVGGSDAGACDGPSGGGVVPNLAHELAGNTQTPTLTGFSVGFNADNTFLLGTNADDYFFCIWQRLDSLTGCAGGACLSGSGGADIAYSANDPCGAVCDADGELWEMTITG